MYKRDFNAPRRSGQPSSFNNASKKEVPLAQLMKDLKTDIIDTIPAPSDAGNSIPVSIQNVEALASYSWLDSDDPTIIVPGSPPIWRERPMPYTVPRDMGIVYLDQNAGRLGSSPLLPLIAAVTHFSPSFPLDTVDFVTDRNGLRKLWRWATHDGEAQATETFGYKLPAGDSIPGATRDTGAGTFRIDVELAGARTILMERWDPEITQVGGPGYEREFERASTVPAAGCEKAIGHHRIMTYDFAGLKMLMRFKVDTCLPIERANNPKNDPLDELTSGLENLKFTKSPKAEKVQIPALNGAVLSVIKSGELVPQSALVELKTRSVRSVDNFNWDDTYPQLLLSQTPRVFVCVHQRGTFHEVLKRELSDLETEALARKAQDGLRKVRKLLGEIADVVRGEGEGARLSLICKDGGDILVYERKGKGGSLPPEVLKRFSVRS